MSFMGDVTFCCDIKQKLLSNYELFSTIVIEPKFIRFSKIHKCWTRKQTVMIRNDFPCSRTIVLKTNFPYGLSIKNPDEEIILQAGDVKCVDVYFEPTDRNAHEFRANTRFSLFVCTRHPKMMVEVPVFFKNVKTVSIPEKITMPRTSPNVFCYYVFPICNFSPHAAHFFIRRGKDVNTLRYMPCEIEIPAGKGEMIYLEAVSPDQCPVREHLILRSRGSSGTMSVIKIKVEAEMIPYMLEISDTLIRFPCTQIGTRSDQCVLLCNESTETIKFKWCRRENKDNCEEIIQTEAEVMEPIVKIINNYFQIKPKYGLYQPGTSESAIISFTPPETIDEEPPIEVKAEAYLACSTNGNKRIKITMIGIVVGPSIEFTTNEIDLGTIFVGEEQNAGITATNTGQVCGNLCFCGIDGCFGGTAEASPQEQNIEPMQSVNFTIKYYARSVGKFIEKLLFKIKYGKCLTILVKGCAVPLEVCVIPKRIDFGVIPICVLQKQYLKICNSLKFPVIVTATVACDGNEKPLLLINENQLENAVDEDDVDENNSFSYPLNLNFSDSESVQHHFGYVNDLRSCCSGSSEKINDNCEADELDLECLTDHLINSNSGCDDFEEFESSSTIKTTYSSEFLNILENSSTIAQKIVANIKGNKLNEEPAADTKIIKACLDQMLILEYFQTRAKDINFRKLKWRALPYNPREILMKTEPFYVDPRQTVDFLIYLIPNRRGPVTLNLNFRITPATGGVYEDPVKMLDNNTTLTKICSHALSLTVQITHNCTIPDLHLTEKIIHIDTYVDYEHLFFFRVKNVSNVDGFFYFHIITENENAELLLKPRKTYIKAEAWRKIYGQVRVSTMGETILDGIICPLGTTKAICYKIIVNTKLPEILVKPKMINVTQKVLEKVDTLVYVKNICSYAAEIELSISFAKPSVIEITPRKVVLQRDEEINIKLTSIFYDGQKHKNQLIIALGHDSTIKIPVRYTVIGYPIEYIPNIRENLDMGVLFTSKDPYKVDIQVINRGHSSYKVHINKLQKGVRDKLNTTNYFTFEPVRAIILEPQETKIITASVKSTERVEIAEEFSVIVNKSQDFNFFAKAIFVRSYIKWSKDEVCFDIKNSELCDKSNVSEQMFLINGSTIPTEVEISVIGNFLIFEPCDRIYGNQFNFVLEGSEHKEFEIFFDMKKIKNENLSNTYNGKIITKAMGRLQKPVLLTARLIYPALAIDEEELQYFSRKQQFYAFFKITNPSVLCAQYKWHLIEENEQPLQYVKTKKMHEQKNISQELLSTPSKHKLWDFLLDVDEKYYENLNYYLDLIPADTDDENEISSTLEEVSTKSESEIKTSSSGKRRGSKIKAKRSSTDVKKSKKGKIKNKESSTESEESQKRKKKIISKSKSSKTSSTTESVASESVNIPHLSVLYAEKHENIFSKYPLDLVKGSSFATEIDNFIKDSTPAEYVEDICSHLLPLRSSDECPCLDKFCYLDRYKGVLHPDECKLINLFFAGHNREVIQKATYKLEVAAGNSTTVETTIYNLNAAVEVSKTNFDFGYQPWYKIHQNKIKLINRNQMNLKVSITENSYLEKYHKLYKGFVTVNPHGIFYLLDEMITELTIKTYMGFSTNFTDGIGIEVNNNQAIPVTFRGKAGIPWLTILNVERSILDSIEDRILEYEFLNKLFFNELFDLDAQEPDVTEEEIQKYRKEFGSEIDNNAGGDNIERKSTSDTSKSLKEEGENEMDEMEAEEEFSKEVNYLLGALNLKDLYIGKNGRVLAAIKQKVKYRAKVIRTLDNELTDYEVLDYPEEYPTILYIECMINTYKFLESLKYLEDVQEAFNKIANKHILETLKSSEECRSKKEKPLIKLNSFIVHPLPFFTTTYFLPIDCIAMNEEIFLQLHLFFHGPGRAIFSVRTLCTIPGLKVEFSTSDDEIPSDTEINTKKKCKFLTYTQKPPAVEPGFIYRNKIERDFYNKTIPDCSNCNKCADCENCEEKLCRAHSYDLDLNLVHERDIPNRKQINDYYNKVMRLQVREEKDPFILSELFQEDCVSTNETLFNLNIRFQPTEEYYEDGTLFEDYLFIDVHLGPVIPILIRGTIRNSNYMCYEGEIEATENISEDF